MPHKTINSYPSIGKEIDLPIFMRACGCYEYQPLDDKPEGYIYHQLYFVEEGRLQLIIENETFEIKEKMGFFIKENTPYRISKLTNLCTTYWVSFGCQCKDMLFPLINLHSPVHIYHNLDIEVLKMQIKKMYLLSTEDTFYSRCQNSSRIYQFVMELFSQEEKQKEQHKDDDENPSLLLAKRYIEQYYFNDLTLDTLASFANVSPQHLCRLFKKHMNMRPTNYINLTRIKVAKWKLHNTDKTITEISEEVGFTTPYYFTNTFKKYENMSPSAYRKMVQSN